MTVGWHVCADGVTRWGQYGAAGVLFVCRAGGHTLHYVVHRSAEVDQGGTWGIPGGAIDPGETAEEAALREVQEEVGYEGEFNIVRRHIYMPCTDWSYTTFVVAEPAIFGQGAFNWETQDGGWYTLVAMKNLNLIAPLRDALPDLLPEVRTNG